MLYLVLELYSVRWAHASPDGTPLEGQRKDVTAVLDDCYCSYRF